MSRVLIVFVYLDLPKLDLELYIQNYEGMRATSNHQRTIVGASADHPTVGRTRFDRLIHIAKTCVPLCLDALKAAINEARQGEDTGRYKEAWQYIRVAAPNEPEAQLDSKWVQNKDELNKRETARLESELKGYKNNLIKESIRVCHWSRNNSLPVETGLCG